MKLEINDSKLSKQSIKQFMKTQWNNLVHLSLCSMCDKIDMCYLFNDHIRVLYKCEWRQLNSLDLSYNMDVSSIE